MTAPVDVADITEDGVYPDLTDEQYHGQRASLSSSGARKLLPPSCPALFHYEREHGRPPKRAFDFGHAAHQMVLGVGAEIVVVQRTFKDGHTEDATDYKAPSAGEHRDAIRAEGKVPLLRHELEQVEAMAAAIREHPIAGVLFDPDRGGRPEVSMFWRDPAWDVLRRARADWLPAARADGRLIVPDYKTTDRAERSAFTRSAAKFGYPVQEVWYRDVITGLGLADDVAFVFVAQEKTPPYLVNVFQLNDGWLSIGRTDVDRALAVYVECTATGDWPGYASDVELLSPPAWLSYAYNTQEFPA